MVSEIKNTVPFIPFIRMYSITFLFGIIILWEGIKHKVWIKGIKIEEDKFDNYIFMIIFSGIAGARIWYTFSALDYYLSNPIKILMVWEGGLAIQGGIIGGLLAIFYFKKKYKIDIRFIDFIDMAGPLIFLAQAIGRWGNFFNQEIYGNIINESTTTLLVYSLTTIQIIIISAIIYKNHPLVNIKKVTRKTFYRLLLVISFLLTLFTINFYFFGYAEKMVQHMFIDGAYRIPLFLVEGVISLILFIMLSLFKFKIPGQQAACFLILFGTLRAILEPLRNQVDIMKIGPIYISIVMSIIYILAGIFLFYKATKQGIKNGK